MIELPPFVRQYGILKNKWGVSSGYKVASAKKRSETP